MSAIWKTQQWPQDWKRSVFIPVPKKGNAKNVQTTIQLCSFHMLASLCSKSFQLGFSSTWTENFQMYKLGFKEAEKPEIKLPTFVGSWRRQGSSKKTSTYASLTMLKTLTMWISTNCGKFLEMGVPDHLTYVLRNCMWVKKQQLDLIWNKWLFQDWERSMTGLLIVTMLV